MMLKFPYICNKEGGEEKGERRVLTFCSTNHSSSGLHACLHNLYASLKNKNKKQKNKKGMTKERGKRRWRGQDEKDGW
jgi:hypothetical protein